ncbi:MAG: DUF3343 domain-containing protein [Acutalibacteraceae bacterium]
MVYNVSSVTNAMRGKRMLAQHGIRAYVKRKTEADIENGCGYSLVVPDNRPEAEKILRENGIRLLSGGRQS